MIYGLVALLVVAAVTLVLAGVTVDGAIIGTDALISLAWVVLQAKRRREGGGRVDLDGR